MGKPSISFKTIMKNKTLDDFKEEEKDVEEEEGE